MMQFGYGEGLMNSYQQLFDAYVDDMREAITDARRWWDALLAIETARHGDESIAREALAQRWPFGIASHPYIVGVYRRWSLECQHLNDDREAADTDEGHDMADALESDWGNDDEPAEEEGIGSRDIGEIEGAIEPRELLIDMLPGRADDVAEVMLDFVFDPMGLDDRDRWV